VSVKAPRAIYKMADSHRRPTSDIHPNHPVLDNIYLVSVTFW